VQYSSSERRCLRGVALCLKLARIVVKVLKFCRKGALETWTFLLTLAFSLLQAVGLRVDYGFCWHG
jgi:hypothetical protein